MLEKVRNKKEKKSLTQTSKEEWKNKDKRRGRKKEMKQKTKGGIKSLTTLKMKRKKGA